MVGFGALKSSAHIFETDFPPVLFLRARGGESISSLVRVTTRLSFSCLSLSKCTNNERAKVSASIDFNDSSYGDIDTGHECYS